MDDMRSRVAYLQGLAEGMEIDATSGEGRVISAIIDVLEAMSDQMQDVVDAQDELAEYLEDVDYDLGAVEDLVYGDDAVTDADDEDVAEVCFIPEAEVREIEDGVQFISCPNCGEPVSAGFGVTDDEMRLTITCPTCGTAITFGDGAADDTVASERGARR